MRARAEEFDLDHARWKLLPKRTKSARSHAVCLSRQAVDLVRTRVERGGYL